ncbi:MAG: hypothetical protein A3D41_04605 [Candidatus Sungbacteria bacterium RIFCSPHIGHO2_02_FULL_41_12b]|nr:MAG: hypothetical protein A3D41_04605 [Candidatus Sungbacteria bacterium RIFCSPHIGHO2_02_FULL_41_12b]
MHFTLTKEKQIMNELKKEVPRAGDRIWLPGRKSEILKIRCNVTEKVETDFKSNSEISRIITITHSLLVEGNGGFGIYNGPHWFEWENSLDKQQEYFKEVFERRNCRKCQFPLPWDKCEIHR